MAASVHTTRLSSGVVVVNVSPPRVRFLLLRAYKNWDFPKGLVEPGEQPIDAALREVREETTLENLSFDWGMDFMETGPYNKGKISRYYVARSGETAVLLPINPQLGMPEHHEARWMAFDQALKLMTPRLEPVLRWANDLISNARGWTGVLPG
jgi:bis(5'-nucleosidyl)-tetraphosphatase